MRTRLLQLRGTNFLTIERYKEDRINMNNIHTEIICLPLSKNYYGD